MKICVLASGSKGNCTFLRSGDQRILIDCGISKPEIIHCLATIGERLSDITTVLLTHEHGDHTIGLRSVVRAIRPEVVLTPRTEEYIPGIDEVAPDYVFVKPSSVLDIGELSIRPISVDHDAANAVAYQVWSADATATIVTDLGGISPELQGCIESTDWLFLEANHDSDMLNAGTYPQRLRERVRENHLSNDKAIHAIANLSSTQIVLGHISEGNNDLRLLRLLTSTMAGRVTIAEPGWQTQIFHVGGNQ
jgi:phosphoribosyl 1,2-cyclic phosphodiesterase